MVIVKNYRANRPAEESDRSSRVQVPRFESTGGPQDRVINKQVCPAVKGRRGRSGQKVRCTMPRQKSVTGLKAKPAPARAEFSQEIVGIDVIRVRSVILLFRVFRGVDDAPILV